MKKLMFAAGAAALALGSASTASAGSTCAATYPHPAQAKQIKSALVQAFVSCNNPGGNTSNGTTEDGVDSCYPAQTYNEAAGSPTLGWFFGPKGKGDITFKAGKNKLTGPSYPQNTDPNASDLYITVKAGDIRNGNGLADASPGSVSSLARATLIDRANNDVMTIFDFPTGFGITANGGKISTKTSASAILNVLTIPALPACTTIELIALQVRDEAGNPFAHMGTFLP